MYTFALFVIAAIAALHVFMAWFEMFAWEEKGPKLFKSLHRDLFKPTRAMAANQGLYNLFLAVGLGWALFIGDNFWQGRIAVCFLLFVVVAGVFGAVTMKACAPLAQAIPASLALGLLFLSRDVWLS